MLAIDFGDTVEDVRDGVLCVVDELAWQEGDSRWWTIKTRDGTDCDVEEVHLRLIEKAPEVKL